MRNYVSYTYPVDENLQTPISVETMGIDYFQNEYRKELWRFDVSFIACVISGRGILHTDSGIYPLHKGDLFILCKNNNYHISASKDAHEPWGFIRFNIRKDYILHLLTAFQIENIHILEHCGLEPLFRKGIELAADETMNAVVKQKSLALLLTQILIEISFIHHARRFPVINTPEDNDTDSRLIERKLLFPSYVQKVKDYIDKHLEDKINLKDLNKIVPLTPRHINNIFKKEVGVTPYNYYILKRIELSKNLLIRTNLSVKEIAQKLKFADEFYFSNIFKKKTGMSPLKYKKEYS